MENKFTSNSRCTVIKETELKKNSHYPQISKQFPARYEVFCHNQQICIIKYKQKQLQVYKGDYLSF